MQYPRREANSRVLNGCAGSGGSGRTTSSAPWSSIRASTSRRVSRFRAACRGRTVTDPAAHMWSSPDGSISTVKLGCVSNDAKAAACRTSPPPSRSSGTGQRPAAIALRLAAARCRRHSQYRRTPARLALPERAVGQARRDLSAARAVRKGSSVRVRQRALTNCLQICLISWELR
jgi:hypothetical protein